MKKTEKNITVNTENMNADVKNAPETKAENTPETGADAETVSLFKSLAVLQKMPVFGLRAYIKTVAPETPADVLAGLRTPIIAVKYITDNELYLKTSTRTTSSADKHDYSADMSATFVTIQSLINTAFSSDIIGGKIKLADGTDAHANRRALKFFTDDAPETESNRGRVLFTFFIAEKHCAVVCSKDIRDYLRQYVAECRENGTCGYSEILKSDKTLSYGTTKANMTGLTYDRYENGKRVADGTLYECVKDILSMFGYIDPETDTRPELVTPENA